MQEFIRCLHKGVSLGTGSSLACTAYMFEQWAYPEFVLFLWDSTKAGRPDFPGCRLQIQGWIFPQLSFLSFEAKILTLFISVKFVFSVFQIINFLIFWKRGWSKLVPVWAYFLYFLGCIFLGYPGPGHYPLTVVICLSFLVYMLYILRFFLSRFLLGVAEASLKGSSNSLDQLFFKSDSSPRAEFHWVVIIWIVVLLLRKGCPVMIVNGRRDRNVI